MGTRELTVNLSADVSRAITALRANNIALMALALRINTVRWMWRQERPWKPKNEGG